MRQMKKPRCGDPDVEEGASRFKRYDAVRSWSKTSFTYYIQYSGQDMLESEQQSAIAEAFQKWTTACNALSFTQTTDSSNPDFKIRSDFTFFFSPENQLIMNIYNDETASLYQQNSKVTY